MSLFPLHLCHCCLFFVVCDIYKECVHLMIDYIKMLFWYHITAVCLCNCYAVNHVSHIVNPSLRREYCELL